MKGSVNNTEKNTNLTILNIINLLCCLYIITWTVLPVFRSVTNQGIFQLVFVGIAVLWLLTSLMISRRWFYELLVISFVGSIYIIIMILYYLFDFGNMSVTQVVGPSFLFLYVYMGYFYSIKSNIKTQRFILIYLAICFLITATTTTYNLLENMNVSRLLTSSSTSPEVVRYLERRNVGSFDFIYGLVILIPILFIGLKLALRNRKKILNFIMMTLIVVLAIVVISLSNFTTAYILLFLAIIVSLLPTIKNIYITFLILCSFAIVFSPLIIDTIIVVLSAIRDATPSIMTQNKLENIINILYGTSSYETVNSRTWLLENSLQSFLMSPVQGVGAYYNTTNIIGDHSQFVDDLGRYGIVGALPIFIFMFYLLQKIKKVINNNRIKQAFIYSSLIFVVLGFLNPIHSYGILFSTFFVLPLYARYLDLGYINER